MLSAKFLHNLHKNEFDNDLLYPAILHRAFNAYWTSLADIEDPYTFWPFLKICSSPFKEYSPLNEYTYDGYDLVLQ